MCGIIVAYKRVLKSQLIAVQFQQYASLPIKTAQKPRRPTSLNHKLFERALKYFVS